MQSNLICCLLLPLPFYRECLGRGRREQHLFLLVSKEHQLVNPLEQGAEPPVSDTVYALQAYCCHLPGLRGWQALHGLSPPAHTHTDASSRPCHSPASPPPMPWCHQDQVRPLLTDTASTVYPPMLPLSGGRCMKEPMLSSVSTWQSSIYPLHRRHHRLSFQLAVSL